MMRKKNQESNRMKVMSEVFQFLIDEYDFELIEKKDDFWYVKLIYKNSTTGLIIQYERKDQYIDIDICRLVNGIMDDNVIEAIGSNDLMNCFSLDYIVKKKEPKDLILPAHEYDEASEFHTPGGFLKYARLFAQNLKKYASDILLGDFSIFNELTAQFKQDYQHNYIGQKRNSRGMG